ncbi:MAG: hypothetical protein O3C43_10070 [Verrucomicrobia bacterium]|nr:hypothetical protein [Verrucomicrobiota bacterium]MDA1066838.1 hypothetical protein [Verrucomicrobiota bacterium]
MTEEEKKPPSDSTGSPQTGLSHRQSSGLAAFWQELKRRKVMRVAITYAVVAWLIIQVASSTFGWFDIPAWAFRLVTLCVILGFPLAVIIAWAFELTPDGIKTTKHAREEQGEVPVSKTQERKRNWLTILYAAGLPTLIFGTLALFLYFRTDHSSPALSSSNGPQVEDLEKSIAVLPFDNRSNREEDLFFTDGIHDELLSQISRIRDIKTISRTSVMGYRGTTKSIPNIGEELQVNHILEGGVQRAGNQIRINVQLIEAAADRHLWAETYTRELTAENVFEIQSEITRTIAQALKAILSPAEAEQLEKLPTDNLAALEAYFRGKEKLEKRSRIDFAEAIHYFEEAISLDPKFAMAHAALARNILTDARFSGLPRDLQAAKAEPHILKALELDDTLSEAHLAVAGLKYFQGDNLAAERAFNRAIELDPNNPDALSEYAGFMGREHPDQSLEIAALYRQAYELDPKHELAQDRLAESFEALDSGQKPYR